MPLKVIKTLNENYTHKELVQVFYCYSEFQLSCLQTIIKLSKAISHKNHSAEKNNFFQNLDFFVKFLIKQINVANAIKLS